MRPLHNLIDLSLSVHHEDSVPLPYFHVVFNAFHPDHKPNMEFSGFTNLPSTDKRGLHSTTIPGHEDAPVARHQTVTRVGGGDPHGPGLRCPFYVRDRNSGRRCLERVLRNAADVRHHIERSHMQYCQPCKDSIGECLGVPFCRPDVTKEQFANLRPPSHETKCDSAVQRWAWIWKVIFPNEPVPECPFASGETVFIQRLLDIRNIIKSGQWKNFAFATTWTDPESFELSVIDKLIDTARQLERLPDDFMPLSGSAHTMPQIFDSANPIPGESSHALPSSSSQPADTRLRGRSPPLMSAGAPFQKQRPSPSPSSECLYNQPTGSQVPFLSQPNSHYSDPDPFIPGQEPLSDEQFQYLMSHSVASPSFDANQLPFSTGPPWEPSPPLSGGSNQLTTNQEPGVHNNLHELYLVDPWNPEDPL